MPDVINMQENSVDLGDYVIDPDAVLDKLEDQYAKYTSLPLDLARRTDDICLQRYGLTNTQLYNNLKAKMLDNIIDPDKPRIIGVREDFELPSGAEDQDDMDFSYDEEDTEDILAKVEEAKSLQSDTCVIIYPLTNMYPFSMDDLEELFSRFNFLSFDLQRLSDQECVRLFGNDNRNMYEINKAKIMARDKDTDGLNSIEADSYFDGVSTFSKNESVGIIELLKKKLDIVNIKENGTLYESTLADDGLEDIDSAIHLKKSTGDAVPEFTPYLIPTEIEQLVGDGTGLSNDEREFLEIYKNSLMEGMKNFDSKVYFEKIKSLYEMRSQNESQTHTINMKMEAYGWNPNLPFNERSFKGARSRVQSYLNEFYNPLIVDIHNFNESIDSDENKCDNLNDGVIFLIKTNDNDKPAIAFSITAKDWYKKGGQVFAQSLDKDQNVTMYMVLVEPEAKKIIWKNLSVAQSYESSKRAIWDTFLPTDDEKTTCAKFLTILAKLCSGEVMPNARVYKIFDNAWEKFNSKYIELLIIDLKLDNPNLGKVLSKYSVQEAVMRLYEHNSIAYLKNIRIDDASNEEIAILKEMKDLLTPSIALSEAKNIPVRINDKGVVFDLPTLVEEEYQTVHKSILVYDKEENYEAMKDSLAHLWYLNLLCERKITKWKDKEKKQEQLKIRRDLRARILNDFKKYLKKVIEHDPEFDFAAYFKKSRWNDRTIFIDAQTIKYTGKIIAAIVKSLITKK